MAEENTVLDCEIDFYMVVGSGDKSSTVIKKQNKKLVRMLSSGIPNFFPYDNFYTLRTDTILKKITNHPWFLAHKTPCKLTSLPTSSSFPTTSTLHLEVNLQTVPNTVPGPQ